MDNEILEAWIKETEKSIDYYQNAVDSIREPELRARYEIVQKELAYKLFALESSRMEW